jgi:hypothetical protein
MPEENPPVDWEKMWASYNNAVKEWMAIFEKFQESTKAVQSMCNDLLSSALKEPDNYSMSQFAENWQKSMADMGFKTFKQFGDTWQNVFNQPAMDQLKAYGELMKKFSEDHSWYEMWNK